MGLNTLETAGKDLEKRASNGYLVWVKGHPNWVLCNGANLSEGGYIELLRQNGLLEEYDSNDHSPGFQIPNLMGFFTKGIHVSNIGEFGGKNSNTLNLNHTHDIDPCGDANGKNALLAQAWQDHVSNCNERSKDITKDSLNEYAFDNNPPFFGTFKIIRIN